MRRAGAGRTSAATVMATGLLLATTTAGTAQQPAIAIVPTPQAGSSAATQAGSSAWGPTLREASAQLANRAIFRGYDIGSPGYEARLTVPVFGHPVADSPMPTRWGLTLHGVVAGAGTVRAQAITGSRVTGTVAASRLLAGTETVVALVGSAYAATDGRTDAGGTELGVALSGVRLPFLGEPDVILDATVLHDFGELDGFYGSLGLGVELTYPGLGQRLTALLGTRLHADDYDAPAADTRGLALETGAGLRMFLGSHAYRNLSLALDGGAVFAAERRTAGVASIGLVLR